MENWKLIDSNNNPVEIGATVTSFRGITGTLEGGTPPHRPGSTGKVYVNGGEYFPSVYDLKWTQKVAA